MMRRIKAWLTGGRCVVLKDFSGELYYTIAYTDPWGVVWAPVYWDTQVGRCILNDDGTVSGRDTYIKKWKYG